MVIWKTCKPLDHKLFLHYMIKVLSDLVDLQVWHIITGSHFCVGSTVTSDNAENLFQYDPGF